MVMPQAEAPAEGSPTGLPQATPDEPASEAGATGDSPNGKPEGGPSGVGPADGEQQQTEDGPPAWAGVSTLDEVLALDEIKSHVDAAVAEGREAGSREMQSQLQPILNKHEEYLGKIDLALTNFGTSWNKIANSGEFTPEDLSKVLQGNAAAFTALVGLQATEGEWMGLKTVFREVGDQLGDKELGKEFVMRADNLKNGLTDPTIYKDFIVRVSAAAVKSMKFQLDEANAHIARIETQDGDDKRKERGQNPARPTGSGGRGISTDSQDRLDRLSMGEDKHGQKATDEDRAWISKLGN